MDEDEQYQNYPQESQYEQQPQQYQQPPSQSYQSEQQQTYPPSQGGEQNYQEYPPQGYYPPPKKKNTKIVIGVVAVVVVVALIVAMLFVLNPLAPTNNKTKHPTIVGTWHITKEKVTDEYGSREENTSMYFVFHSNGTGKIYSPNIEENEKFHWKDVGHNRVEININANQYSSNQGSGESDVTITITMNYTITGKNIVFNFKSNGATITLYGERVSSVPQSNTPQHEIASWQIYIDNGYGFNLTKVITAHTTSTGEAKWSGQVKIVIYDENGEPLPNVKVVLDGCGVTEAGQTDSNGTVIITLNDVTLPSGAQQDQIQVKMQYPTNVGEQTKTDTITVIRSD